MAWFKKEHSTRFDSLPISGLYFLDGDRVSASMPWAKDQRRPVIAFPSGALCDLARHPDPENATVHIAGALNVPLYGAIDEALVIARDVGKNLWYDVEQHDDQTLVVSIDGDEQIHLLYDATTKRLSDVQYIRAGKFYPQSTALLLDADARLHLPDLTYPVLPSSYANVKLTLPELGWTWYPFAFDGEDMLFGLVCTDRAGLATFSLYALAQLRSPLGFGVEQDFDFAPTELRELKKLHAPTRSKDETPSAPKPSGAISGEVERLLTLKDELMTRFHQLPAEHQATMGLVLVQSILAGEWGAWFQEAAATRFAVGDTITVRPAARQVTREHLRQVHFSEEDIAQLSDDDLRTIASLVDEHYRTDTFWDDVFFVTDLLLTGRNRHTTP